MAAKTHVDGIEIELAGEAYALPPLPLAKMPKIKKLMEGGDLTDEFVGCLVDAIHWSLQRNYPDLGREVVETNVDMLNWKEILDAFMETNGFAQRPGAGAPSGEAHAAASTK